jgi:hypothetical protein
MIPQELRKARSLGGEIGRTMIDPATFEGAAGKSAPRSFTFIENRDLNARCVKYPGSGQAGHS